MQTFEAITRILDFSVIDEISPQTERMRRRAKSNIQGRLTKENLERAWNLFTEIDKHASSDDFDCGFYGEEDIVALKAILEALTGDC